MLLLILLLLLHVAAVHSNHMAAVSRRQQSSIVASREDCFEIPLPRPPDRADQAAGAAHGPADTRQRGRHHAERPPPRWSALLPLLHVPPALPTSMFLRPPPLLPLSPCATCHFTSAATAAGSRVCQHVPHQLPVSPLLLPLAQECRWWLAGLGMTRRWRWPTCSSGCRCMSGLGCERTPPSLLLLRWHCRLYRFPHTRRALLVG